MDEQALLPLMRNILVALPKGRHHLRKRVSMWIRQFEYEMDDERTRRKSLPDSPTKLQRRLESYRGPFKLEVSIETLRKRLLGITDWPVWDLYRAIRVLGLDPADQFAAFRDAALNRRRWLEAEARRVKHLRGH